jgi:hypothetical protein
MRHMKRLNWWAPGRIRRVPITPEEKLIPPLPMKTKLTVTAETLAIAGLGIILYLDYINNQYLQGFVTQTSSQLLAGINVWTGVILGITSFLTTYILLRGKSRTSKTNKPDLLHKVSQHLGKLRPKRAKVPSVIAISVPSSSIPLTQPSTSAQISLNPASQGKDASPQGATVPGDGKKESS